MQFELNKTKVKVLDFNPRTEFHGEEHRLAGDLKIGADLDNGCLAMFHPALRSLLYHYDPQVAGDLVDAAKRDEDPDYAPNIRMPHLVLPLKWDGAVVGAGVEIHYGLKSKIQLETCNVNDFKLEPKQGGTVTVTFMVRCHPADDKEAGKLCGLIQSDVELSVTPPVSEQQELDEK